MRRSSTSLLGLLCLAAFVVSCRDDRNLKSPTSPQRPGEPSADVNPGPCLTFNNLLGLLNTIFGAGSANATQATTQFLDIGHLVAIGNIAAAQAETNTLIAFILSHAPDTPAARANVRTLIAGLDCRTGIVANSGNVFTVYPGDPPETFIATDGLSGIFFPGNAVDQPIVVTINTLPTSGLITKLDQYPTDILVTSSGPVTKPVVVGVCPSIDVPPDVLDRLRLGHQATGGFEITPAADASFLTCPVQTGQSRVPGWLKSLASLVLPKPLYAKMRSGGVGGTATEFSPFGPVDPALSFSGGVGGTATEFQKLPPTVRVAPSSPSASRGVAPGAPGVVGGGGVRNTVVNGTCVAIDAPVGMPVENACRPEVTLQTHNGTIMQNVPVGWSIGLGGGTAAPENRVTQTCGAFGATAATTTDVVGKATVCWNLGAAGTNTVIATPTAGGDAPPGVTFNPAHITFTATATRYATTSTVSCPVFVLFTGSPVTPCSGAVTGPGLSLPLTPTYASNVVGTATASVNFAGDLTHLPSNASTTFKILYVQSSCFAPPLTSTMPPSTTGQTKGATLPVACTLRTAQHTPALNVTGDLLVQDKGVTGLSDPVTVLSLTNAFRPTANTVYSYPLNTSPEGFVSHHYYLVTATWNDGSTSVGWFRLR